jgi:hypothetical protein
LFVNNRLVKFRRGCPRGIVYELLAAREGRNYITMKGRAVLPIDVFVPWLIAGSRRSAAVRA